MMNYLQTSFDSRFYGYVNGDILMHSSLESILESLSKQPLSDNHILLTGRRFNTYVSSEFRLSLRSRETMDRFIEESIIYNEQFIPVAQDYFIFTKATFTSANIVPIVIGRNRYDNYLLTVCKLDRSCNLIDASHASS